YQKTANNQYTNVTINPGVRLFEPSDVIIRCTGTFTNNGSISVERGAEGVQRDPNDAANTVPPAPEAGVSLLGSTFGELGDFNAVRHGGHPGIRLGTDAARTLLFPGVKAGAAGPAGLGAT